MPIWLIILNIILYPAVAFTTWLMTHLYEKAKTKLQEVLIEAIDNSPLISANSQKIKVTANGVEYKYIQCYLYILKNTTPTKDLADFPILFDFGQGSMIIEAKTISPSELDPIKVEYLDVQSKVKYQVPLLNRGESIGFDFKVANVKELSLYPKIDLHIEGVKLIIKKPKILPEKI